MAAALRVSGFAAGVRAGEWINSKSNGHSNNNGDENRNADGPPTDGAATGAQANV